MGNYLRDLLNFGGLEVDYVVGFNVVFEVPQVDAEVVRGEEVLAVGAAAEGVDVVVVAVFVLHARPTLVRAAGRFGLRHDEVPVRHAGLRGFSLRPRVKFPELDDSVVGRKQLQAALFGVVQKFKRIDFFFELNRLQVVELRFVRLDFAKVPVVEVTTRLEVHVSEDNHSASLVAHG